MHPRRDFSSFFSLGSFFSFFSFGSFFSFFSLLYQNVPLLTCMLALNNWYTSRIVRDIKITSSAPQMASVRNRDSLGPQLTLKKWVTVNSGLNYHVREGNFNVIHNRRVKQPVRGVAVHPAQQPSHAHTPVQGRCFVNCFVIKFCEFGEYEWINSTFSIRYCTTSDALILDPNPKPNPNPNLNPNWSKLSAMHLFGVVSY